MCRCEGKMTAQEEEGHREKEVKRNPQKSEETGVKRGRRKVKRKSKE